jgi:sugar phosphate isomerase/epimerase
MRLSAITDEISQDLRHALSVMAEYDIREAELRNVYGKYIVEADEELLEKVEKDLKDAGMTICCLDTPFYKCDLDDADTTATGPTHGARDRGREEQLHLLNRSIDLARRLGTSYIRIFSFWKRGPLTMEIEERIADALMTPARIAERAGVTLVLENEHACYLGTGAETARVIEKVGSSALKMVWDPGNAFMAGEQPFPSGYQAAAAHIGHVHVKDAHADESGKLSFTVIGGGEIDYVGQFAALKESGYTGAISLETHYKGPNGDIESASRECLAALRKLI